LFNFKQFLLIGGSFQDQSLLLFFQIWSFFLDQDTKQLIIKTFISDHEVDQSDFGGDFGQIVRVSVFGSNVKDERAGVLDDLITELDEDARAFLICLFQQDWVQSGVELLADVLQ
jgi:hypothetical protein